VIRFAHPLWLALLALVIARVVLAVRDRRRRFGAFRFSSFALVSQKHSLRARLVWLPLALEIAGLLLLAVALARPQRVTRASSSDRFGIDIVVAIDASGSMAAEDFRPRNRFSVARDLVSEFIGRRVDDRIGIVTFGNRATTRVPITFDREIARSILGKAQIGENGNGTAIGHALATSVNRLRGSRTRSRVVILVTDGVNNAGSIDPLVAASLAAKFGIKVYTIGVGSEGPVPLPVKRQNPFTGEMETVYHHIRGEIDEKTLSAIAAATGGEYFRATDARAMGQVFERIDGLEKSRLNAPRTDVVDELYHWPAAASAAFLGFALLLGESFLQKVTA
jgi:Ca-activated chloride channel family protein